MSGPNNPLVRAHLGGTGKTVDNKGKIVDTKETKRKKKAAEEKKKKEEAEKAADKAKLKQIEEFSKSVNSDEQRIIARQWSKYFNHWKGTHKGSYAASNYLNIKNNSEGALATRTMLFSVPGMEKFVSLSNAKLSSLTPRVRLFKTIGPAQVEFLFDDHQDPSIITMDRGMRGSGAGIKSVSIDMEGDSIATSDRMYKVKIKLFFASLEEVFKTRMNNGSFFKSYQYADLLKLPGMRRDPGQVNARPASKQEYAEVIKMEYGFAKPLSTTLGWTNDEIDVVRRAKRIINLGLYKHSLDYNENGSVNIELEYHGYVERESMKIDVLKLGLSDSEIKLLSDIERNISAIQSQSSSPGKNPSAPKDGTKELREDAAEIRTKGYESFFKRIMSNKKLYAVKTKKAAFSTIKNDEEREKYGVFELEGEIKDADVKGDSRSSDEKIIKFFYLGDLLDEVLSVAKSGQSETFASGKFQFAFGSFMFKSISGGKSIEIPISSVPVSSQAFEKWFKENVIKKGERVAYDLMSFLTDILRSFVTETYSPRYQRTSYGLSVRSAPQIRSQTFNTTKKLGGDYISPSSFRKLIEVSGDHKASVNYIYFYAENLQAEDDSFTGTASGDAIRGIHWLISGAEQGITKKVKYSKNDQKFLTEARMTSQGINDKKRILWSLYKANVDMVGNPIFKPGMIVYITSNSFSQQDADDLGLGGYFQIIKVGNSIADGKYQTELETIWVRPTKGR